LQRILDFKTMCTNGRAKLKEVEQEIDSLYAALRSALTERDQAVNETKIAEDNHDRVCQRNMRLRETADISILWMIFAFSLAIISIGILVYAETPPQAWGRHSEVVR